MEEKNKKPLKKTTKSIKSVINTNPQLPGVVENGPVVAKTPLAEKILRLAHKSKLRNEQTSFKLMQEDVDKFIDAILTENIDDKLEKLLRVGLGDKNKLNQYRQALSNPDEAVKTVVLRKHIVDVLNKLLKIVSDDAVLYQRLLANLQKKRSVKESSVTVALKTKSQKSGIDFETLAEVYYRGVQSWTRSSNATPMQHGFNRVNSFINNGRAARLDEDLIPQKKTVWAKTYQHKKHTHDLVDTHRADRTFAISHSKQRVADTRKPGRTRLIHRNAGEIKINEDEGNQFVDLKPKIKKKTLDKEIYTVKTKTMDPMSEGNVDPKKRFIGTDSLVNTYKKDTPGEKKKLKETTTSGGFKGKVDVADVPVRLVTGKIKRLPPAKSSSSKGGD